MNLVLTRVDDRLVHGQVVVGCCLPLNVRRLLFCNDGIASDALQRRIYAAAVPPEIDLEILDRSETLRRLEKLASGADEEATLLLTESAADVLWLVEQGAPIDRVDLGGMHHRPGAEELWPGYFLTAAERRAVQDLLARGVAVTVRPVVGSPGVDAAPALVSGRGRPSHGGW